MNLLAVLILKRKKETVRKNFFDGGRNTHFHQDATFTYNFPTIKFPVIDWTSLRASYKADYDWIGASLLAKGLGNIITNGKTTNLNADLGFEQLYNKSRFLRAVYSNTPATAQQNNNPPSNNPSNTKKGNKIVKTDSLTRKEARKLRKLQRKEERKLRKAQKQNSLPEVNGIVKGAAKLVTSLKRVGIQYTETAGTFVAGLS
jgi:cell surface protein SprA